ncbi:hypothetical protein [Alkaliphilus transvaalensis]|uniref:hypothetical protein n=1 Tax=Alkaliphilus transvaalensis TaxID=114628 RepID=UPI00047C8482|nr:hypothetical protein [Alkaliphilus transvaalensis]
MMKYQPTNHNFVPKNIIEKKDSKTEVIEKNDQKDKNDKIDKIAEEKSSPVKMEPLPVKEPPLIKRDVFKSEESLAPNIQNNDVNYLREQLSHSENQLATLEIRLQESTEKILALEDELKNYEMYKNDITKVSDLSANLSKLTLENTNLKTQLQNQKDHVQMLYFILIILAIL